MPENSPNEPDEPRSKVLPPVEPPSPGFLVQLFLIPMVIVSVIVLIVLAVNWLRARGTDPSRLVDKLGSTNAGSWQAALDVAKILNDSRDDSLRKSEDLARKLADLLRQENERQKGSKDEDRLKLRIYLCIALGKMEVDVGLKELVAAAELERQPLEVEVRKTAIESIARRIESQTNKAEDLRMNTKLMDALFDASSQSTDNPEFAKLFDQLRYTAAYTLGVVGGDKALDRLSGMQSDSVAAVRFNAATGLARAGDERCTRRLLEMLDTTAPIKDADGKPVHESVRRTILLNGIRAAGAIDEAPSRLRACSVAQSDSTREES